MRVRRRSVGVVLLGTVLVATTAVVAAIGLSFHWSSERAHDDARRDAAFQAGLAAESVQTSLDGLSQTLAGVATASPTFTKLHAPEQCSLSAAGLGGFPGSHVDLVRPDGQVVCSSLAVTGAPAGASHGAAPWVAQTLASGSPVIGQASRDDLTGRMAVTVSARLVEAGRPVAVVAAVVPVRGLADLLARAYAGPRSFTFTVVETSPGIVRSASGVEDEQWKALDGTGFGTRNEGTWTGLDDTERLFSSAVIPALGWRVYAGLDAASVTGAATEAASRQLLLAVVALLAVAAFALFMSRRIIRPLQAVTVAIVSARDEPMPAPVPVKGPREVAVLAAEFNAMIEARLDYEAQLTSRALHDDLTQLPNRALLRDRLERAICTASPNAPLAVLFLDLDRFKLVNDSLGHPAGDALLQSVAQRLAGAARPGDTLARFGGDEFVLVCDNVDGPAGAVEIARSLEAALEAPFVVVGTEVDVAATIGIALTTDAGANPDELVREADIAMYQAKAGTRPWELWDEDLHARSAHRLELQHDLRSAIARRELVVAYQPIWDIEEWQIVSVEALVRWDHPRLGRLAPSQFIQLAEDSGQIGAIGTYVLDETCRFVGELRRAGHELTASVNITVSQLDDDLVNGVRTALAAAGLEPNNLCLELTESSLCDALGSRADTLTRLRAMGVHAAVDDFGTGYSSLSYFQHFPFDTLKVDRSFVEPLGLDDGRAGALVDAIMSMARALDLHVVAEGVETAEQLAAIRRLGCRYVQGYFLARPLTPTDLNDLLRRQHDDRVAIPKRPMSEPLHPA